MEVGDKTGHMHARCQFFMPTQSTMHLQVPLVCEQVDLGSLLFHVEVVRVLALEALGALAMAEKLAHDGLWVHA